MKAWELTVWGDEWEKSTQHSNLSIQINSIRLFTKEGKHLCGHPLCPRYMVQFEKVQHIWAMATPGQSKDTHCCFLHLCVCSLLGLHALRNLLSAAAREIHKGNPQSPEICSSYIYLGVSVAFGFNIPHTFWLFSLPWICLVQLLFKGAIFGPHSNPQQRDAQIKHNLLEEPALPLYSESVYFMFHFMLHSSCLENRVNKLLAK